MKFIIAVVVLVLGLLLAGPIGFFGAAVLLIIYLLTKIGAAPKKRASRLSRFSSSIGDQVWGGGNKKNIINREIKPLYVFLAIFLVIIAIFGYVYIKSSGNIKFGKRFHTQAKNAISSGLLKYKIVERKETRTGDTSRMVFRVVLSVEDIPSDAEIRRTVLFMRKNGNTHWDRFVIFMYLPEMNLDGPPFAAATFVPDTMEYFKVDMSALRKTKWQKIAEREYPGLVDNPSIKVEEVLKRSENPSQRTAASSYNEQTLEYKLAVINAGYRVPDNDSSISRFGSLLDSIQRKCRNGRRQIADMTVFAQRQLEEKGVKIALLELMEKLDYSIPNEAIGANLDFAEVTAAFITITGRE